MPRMRLRSTGVLDVFTHEHRPKLRLVRRKYTGRGRAGAARRSVRSMTTKILFSGQPVALVVAEEFEIARFAASLVRVEYEQEAHVTDFEAQRERAKVSKQDGARRHSARQRRRGVRAGGRCGSRPNTACRSSITIRWSRSPRRRSGRATTSITVYDKTQGPQNCRNYVADVFGMPRDKVRVLSPLCRRRIRVGACGRNTSCRLPRWRRCALERSVRVNADPPADVHARLSRRRMIQDLALGGRRRRQARLVPARRRRR